MSNHVHTLADLETEFLAWLGREVQAGRNAERTLRYYRDNLRPFVASAGGAGKPLSELVRYDLERCKTGWHSCQVVQRLFNWGVENGLIATNPFIGIAPPPLGQRERILSRAEEVLILRRARPPFRRYLLGMRHSLARPGEIRSLVWGQLLPDMSAFQLTTFKAKRRRKDGVRVRFLCVDRRLRRMLERLRERQPCGPCDAVFLDQRGKPWTPNAVRCAMRRLRDRCGLGDKGEPVVCYTLRHTGATQATANGVRDKLLAELLGHVSTRTTARYQHLQASHLSDVIDQATRRRAV